jgi:hypothetical protein
VKDKGNQDAKGLHVQPTTRSGDPRYGFDAFVPPSGGWKRVEQLVQDHLDDPLAPFPVAPSRNLGRPELVPVAELANDCGIDLRLPALVHATRLCCGNAFGLPFLSQVGFNVIVSL